MLMGFDQDWYGKLMMLKNCQVFLMCFCVDIKTQLTLTLIFPISCFTEHRFDLVVKA